MPKPISIIFGALQCRFILNTPIDSKFIKFIIQSGTMWQKLKTWILLSTNAKGSSAYNVQQNKSGQFAE